MIVWFKATHFITNGEGPPQVHRTSKRCIKTETLSIISQGSTQPSIKYTSWSESLANISVFLWLLNWISIAIGEVYDGNITEVAIPALSIRGCKFKRVLTTIVLLGWNNPYNPAAQSVMRLRRRSEYIYPEIICELCSQGLSVHHQAIRNDSAR